ncbi:MAG: hypothetical protein CVU90_11135 [Firmicutes bacterium HGW-Firmicutes-15]|nr:MAG: hypothetical protein CVU90_11135 [Firmicutes bacterium HGW-Firmicutes-15]
MYKMLITTLLKRRLFYRLHIIKELLSLIIDFWVSLYIIVPGLILAGSFYLELIQSLPAWYSPGFQVLWPLIISLCVAVGPARTYMSRADLIFVYHHKSDFRKIVNYGQIISIILKSLPIIIVLVIAYPFYHHIQQFDLNTWLWLSLWVLAIKVMVLIINWHLANRLSSWTLKAAQLMVALAFFWSWLTVLAPVLQPEDAKLSLALNGCLWLVMLILIKKLLPINNWDMVAAAEENYDMSMMRMFLGYQAQVQVSGKAGKAWWGRSRLGIAFDKKATYTYFFIKYFFRKRGLYFLCGQFYLLAGFLLVEAVPFWYKLVFMIGALSALGFMMQMVWQEHSQDIFLRMLPVRWEDLQHGITTVFRLLLIPLCLLFVLVPIAGNGTWLEGLVGLVIILISALAISRYLGLRVSVLFNYDQNRQ